MCSPAKSAFGILLLLSLTLSSCATPVVTLFNQDDPGVQLSVGESSNVHFFTIDPNFDTGITLGAGDTYDLDITILSHWMDAHITANENGEALNERGFDNSLMPIEMLGLTRRSRDHRWFELMMYQAGCGNDSLRGVTDLSNSNDSESYRFQASCDGNLRLFVNDTPGFYINNAGYANINLTRVN